MDDDDDIDDNIIVATETGFETSLDVASEYFKYIIGKKGDTRNRIEMDTRTQIRIPRRGQEGKIGEKLFNKLIQYPHFYYILIYLSVNYYCVTLKIKVTK